MRHLIRPLCLLFALTAWVPPVHAQSNALAEVDLELILMVDVSRSMSPHELEIQRRGYATALQSDVVFAAVQAGLLQRVALSYVEWAGTQRVVVDWQLLETRADLERFAARLTAQFEPTLRRTSISNALAFAAESLNTNAYQGLRRVIDVSGDGPNNQGRPVLRARDAVLAQGIIINGLPLMTRDGIDYARGSRWYLEDLDVYYQNCVIGGPGAFVIPVLDWDDFAEAVRRKLVLEMVAAPAPLIHRTQSARPPPYDCLIGEKLWEERRRYWDEP